MRKLAVLAVSAAALMGTPASAISTLRDWDGSSFVWPYGCPDTSTYGQVIRVPRGKTTLNSFSFLWANNDGSRGSMTVRGEVYAWDGEKATGSAVYESEPRKISYKKDNFHKVTFAAMAPVTPGARYVIFASTDKDHEQCSGDYLLEWAIVNDASYPKGTFVYQNNGGDESQWTTSPWTTDYGSDTAFKATFGP